MKLRYIIAVALIFILAVFRFTPGLVPRTLEKCQKPAVTKARRHDYQGIHSTAQRHPKPSPTPSSEVTDSSGAMFGSSVTHSAATYAPRSGDPASNAFTKLNGCVSQSLSMSPFPLRAKRPAASAQSAGSVADESVSVTETPTDSAQDPAPQPAAWVDLGSASTLTPEQDHEVQQMAEELTARLSQSGLDPSSDEYRRLWNDSVRQSDFIFMQRFGGEAWEAHHIQAYHLAHEQR